LNWVEVSVLVQAELAELVANLFEELGAGGVVIEDPAVFVRAANRIHPEEWAVTPCTVPEGKVVIKSYFPLDGAFDGRLHFLQESLSRLPSDGPPQIGTRVLAESDWANAWRAYYKTIHIGEKMVIKPAWLDYRAGTGEVVIEMDPGMAFGCGSHPTTALCLKLIEKYLHGGELVYDVGTGSGILSVAAAKLGAARVVAVDADTQAVRAAQENAERNGVAGQVIVVQGNLLEPAEKTAALVVANIIADVIIAMAPATAAVLEEGGTFISSGIIAFRSEDVSVALAGAGFVVLEQVQEGEWVAFAAKKGAV